MCCYTSTVCGMHCYDFNNWGNVQIIIWYRICMDTNNCYCLHAYSHVCIKVHAWLNHLQISVYATVTGSPYYSSENVNLYILRIIYGR